jgi:hypothetical protein
MEQTATQKYARDMIGLEQHILAAVERQSTDQRVMQHESINTMMGRLKATLQDHTAALEAYLRTSDGSTDTPAAIRQLAGNLSGTLAGFFTEIRPGHVSQMLRDDYAVLSMATMNYTILHTVALAEEDSYLAQLAIQHLADLTPLIVDVSKLLPMAVTQELFEEGKITDISIGQQALHNTQNAWSSDVTETANKTPKQPVSHQQ